VTGCYGCPVVKIPEFEPAVARVLAVLGGILGPKGSVDAEAVARRLELEEDPRAAELAKDLPRIERALAGLRSEGLLEPSDGGYRLTDLGRARLTRRPDDDA
jgi:hypothetical protein